MGSPVLGNLDGVQVKRSLPCVYPRTSSAMGDISPPALSDFTDSEEALVRVGGGRTVLGRGKSLLQKVKNLQEERQRNLQQVHSSEQPRCTASELSPVRPLSQENKFCDAEEELKNTNM